MATTMSITEINIITVDKSEESWLIEGEIIFEEEFSSSFEGIYNTETEEFEELIIENEPKSYDKDDLIEKILKAVEEYE